MNTANLFIEKGHQVTIIIFDETAESFFPIDKAVRIVQHPFFFGITASGNFITRKTSFIREVIRLRRIVKALKPDLVIATEYPFAIASILAGARRHSKVFTWEHHHFHELKKSFTWERLFRMCYPKLDGVICLNPDEQLMFREVNKNCLVIPNFINSTQIVHAPTNTILTVARLTRVKGIDMLLPVAGKILNSNAGWKWKIIGDGEMKNEVLEFIAQKHLGGRLILQPPMSHEITHEYQSAGLYVMTSRNECFPMTLLEAMSNGLPCVAFDCETGPRHIIRHGEDGLLVENGTPDKMVEAIFSLINDDERRSAMSKRSNENVKRFSGDSVYESWKTVLNDSL